MKVIIIILLIYYSLCEIIHLKKYGRASTYESSGIVYLDAEEFDLKENIHILFMANEGKMDKEINYGFNNTIPTLNVLLPFSKSPTYSESFSNDDNYGKKYYYDIEKTENTKYLVIKYKGFQSEYNGNLEIENMRFSSIFYIIIIITVIVICLGGNPIFFY